MKGYVFVTFVNTDDEIVSTHVVKESKLDQFINDKYALFGVGIAYIHTAVETLNGSIGKGTYLTLKKIYH